MGIAADGIALDTARRADVATFTKWMVGDGPGMAGVVGGAVGDGTYAGQVLDYQPGDTQLVEARYGFEGSVHAFTALVHVEQTGLEAVISGVVTAGWGKGRAVRGSYREVACEHDGVTTDCWTGSIELLPDAEG